MSYEDFTFGVEDLLSIESMFGLDPGIFCGHLLPSNIVNPAGSMRGAGGSGSPLYSPGGSHSRQGFGSCCGSGSSGVVTSGGYVNSDYGSLSIGQRTAPQSGLVGVPAALFDDESNPYDPRITCQARCYCPGAGIGLPCCSATDTFTGGHFQLTECPKGVCSENY